MAPVAGQEGFVSNRLRLFELLRWMLIVLVPALPAAAQTATPIPPEFFSVSMINAKDSPAVPMGTIGHGDFAWQRIEQVKGTFDFTLFDAYVAAAQANGLVDAATNTANVAITLAAGTPGWAVADKSTCGTTNGVSVCTAPPDNLQDWKDFVTALLAHYNGTAKPHIRIYELWNEFNLSLWWTGTDAQLVALAQAAYPIVHADPNSILLTPSVAGPVGTASPHSGVTHMTSYLQAGGAAYADGGSFHGYVGAQNNVNPFPMPEDDGTAGCTPFVTCYGSIVTKATQMRAVFDQTGLLGKPMYQTEGSWGNGTVTDSNTQTAWITRFTLLQAGLHSSLNLQLAAWFTWAQPAFGWGIIEDASGNPTAAGAAYREVYHWLVGATLAQPCTGGVDGTWTCSLTRPGGYVEGCLEHEGERDLHTGARLRAGPRPHGDDDVDHRGCVGRDRHQARPYRREHARAGGRPEHRPDPDGRPGRAERDARVHAAPAGPARGPRHVLPEQHGPALALLPIANDDPPRPVSAQHGRPDERAPERRVREGLQREPRGVHGRDAPPRRRVQDCALRQVPERLSEHGRQPVHPSGLG